MYSIHVSQRINRYPTKVLRSIFMLIYANIYYLMSMLPNYPVIAKPLVIVSWPQERIVKIVCLSCFANRHHDFYNRRNCRQNGMKLSVKMAHHRTSTSKYRKTFSTT